MTALQQNIIIGSGETWRYSASLLQSECGDVIDLTGCSAQFVASAQQGTGHPVMNLASSPALVIYAANFTASIVGNVMTVTAIASGTPAPGLSVFATGIPLGTTIAQQLSGISGGIGNYQLSNESPLNLPSQKVLISEIALLQSVSQVAAINTAGMQTMTISEVEGVDDNGNVVSVDATGPTGFYELFLTDTLGYTSSVLAGNICFAPGVPTS